MTALTLLTNPQDYTDEFYYDEDNYDTCVEIAEFYRTVAAQVAEYHYDGDIEAAKLDLAEAWADEGGDKFAEAWKLTYQANLILNGVIDAQLVDLLDILCPYENLYFNDQTDIEEILF